MPVRRLRLAGARYTLGSSSGCSIRLDDSSLRPMHAVILRDPERTLLRAYSVPVEVNGRRTTEAILEPGDLFSLGQYQFEYVRPHAPAVPADASQRPEQSLLSSASLAKPPAAGKTAQLQVPRRVSFASGMRLPAEAPRPPAPASPAVDPLARLREQQYEQQLADVLARFAQTQQRADQADQSIDLMRQQIDQLAKQLAGAAEMAQRYQDEQEVLRQAKQQAHIERAAALHQRDQAIQQQEEAGRQRDDARSAAETAESDAQRARQRCEQLTQQHAAAIQQVEQLTQRFEDASAQLEQASERCRRLSEQCDRITAEQERTVAQRDQIAAERDRAVEQHDRMRQQHDAVCEERISLAEERDQLAAARQRLTDDCERIAQERDRIADLLSEMQQQRDQAAATAQQHLEQLADQQAETERLEQTIARLEAMVQQSDAARQQDRLSWEAEAAELQETIQSVSGELATTAAQLAQSREAADTLSGQLQEAREALSAAEAQVLDARSEVRDAHAEAATASRRAADAQGRATAAEARASDAQARAMAAEARARDAEARGTTDAAAKQAADAELLGVQQRLEETETQLEQLRRDDDARPVVQPDAPSAAVPPAEAEYQADADPDMTTAPDAEVTELDDHRDVADQDVPHMAWMPPSPWAISSDVEVADADDAPRWADPQPWVGPSAASASEDGSEAEDDQPADAVGWQPPQGLEEDDVLARRLREQLEAQMRREPEDQPEQEYLSEDLGHTCVMPADSLRSLQPVQDDQQSLSQWNTAADADEDAADTDVREYLSGSLTQRSAEDGTVPGAAAETDDGDLRPAWAVAAEQDPPATGDDPLLSADPGAWNQRPVGLEELIEAPPEAPESADETQWPESAAEPMQQLVDRLDDDRAAGPVGDDADGVDTADEDDSIEAYMNRLLQRVQGRGGKTSTGDSATRWTPAPPPVAPQSAAETRPVGGQQSSSQRASATTSDATLKDTAGADGSPTATATSAGAADHEPFVPRSTAPERNSNLAAMRELANSSARTAIQRSVRQRAQTTVLVKFAQAAASASVGTVLWITSQLQFGWRMVAAVCLTFLAAYWVYEAFQLFASLRGSAVETDEPSSIDTPADQDEAANVN